MHKRAGLLLSRLFMGIMIALMLFVPEAMGQNLSEDFLDFFHYREIGPTRQGGRVVAFAVVKQNPHTFYVGAGPGGVWKTTNNGHSFFPVFDHENISSIGDIAVAPSDPNIVWIGTGEANLRNSTYFGNGLYKSTDGGNTWSHRGLEESHHIGRVVIHPENANIVYVAAQGHLYSENPERGVYKTTDGGKTWTKSLEVVVDDRYVGATELVMKTMGLVLSNCRFGKWNTQDNRWRKILEKAHQWPSRRNARKNRPGHVRQKSENPLCHD
jgi:photosystem II stability/assembly factor-like uncharacterized protein